MFKNQLLALCTLFMLVVACSKKDNNQDNSQPVNAGVKGVQDYLSQTDSLKTFGSAFETVTFTDADVSGGITVFAPVNSAITSYDPNARVEATSLSAAEVKDHVVKGVIKKADLTHGKKLTTLSGKELVVTVDGDKIRVNGVLILSGKEDGMHVVYTIDNVLSKKPGTAEITVLDGTLWSTTDTLGKTAAGADVALYYTRKDFQNNQPAFTGKTDANGKITFASLPAGTYYLAVKKDDKYNYLEPISRNGQLVAYKPIGIWQTFDQLNNSQVFIGGERPGDFMYQDVNFDRTISDDDKTPAPAEVVVTSNKTVQVRSLIGYLYNHMGALFANKADAQQELDAIYTQIGLYYNHQMVVADGILSDDADCIGNDGWCDVDNFNLNGQGGLIMSGFWFHYYEIITRLNRVIKNVPALNLSGSENNNLVAQAQALRGYLYYQLATYWGGLVLKRGIPDLNLSRASIADSYAFIKNDLSIAMGLLPARFTGADHRRINANACKLLLARVAMAEGDYNKAKQLTNELIQSSTYSLVAASDILINEENAEIIWTANSDASWGSFYYYFNENGVTRNFIPVARYAEVLLLNTEARINMNDLDATYINQLLTRRGQSTVSFTDASQARSILQTVWKNELYKEGQRFAKLVKWNLAATVLGPKGYKSFNNLMPIPDWYIERNPGVVQNPGY